MSLAVADKLLKIFEALKNFREGIPVADPNPLAKKKECLLPKKDRISHLNSIPELTCSTGVRNLSEFPKIFAIAVDTLFGSCDDQESDVRLVAGEALDRLIKGLLDTNLGRIHVELYKEIKKNGAARSLRAALTKFADLCYLIRPQKCRPFIANLLPCIAHICLRVEDPIQETLAYSIQKIFPILGSFTSDAEVKLLIKAFLPNLRSMSATTRRTAASCLAIICEHSRNPNYFHEWILNVLLGSVLPYQEGKNAAVYLGVLQCLRNIIPNLSESSSEPEYIRGSFGTGKTSSSGTDEVQLSANLLLQVYEVIMYCTKHPNHNVVTASLETLQQLLRNTPPRLLHLLLSSEGITPTDRVDTAPEDLDLMERTTEKLETESIASTVSTLDTGIGSADGNEFEADQRTDELLASVDTESLAMSTISGDNRATSVVSDVSFSCDEIVEQEADNSDASCGVDDTFRKMRIRSKSDPGHAADECNDAELGEASQTDDGARQTHDEYSKSTARKGSDAFSKNFELAQEVDPFTTESISTQDVKVLVERSFQIDAVACVGVPLVHCVRLMCSFLLSGRPGEMLPDSSVRVSVKSAALACIAQAVRFYPEAFLGRVLPEPGDGAEPSLSEQLVRDILLYSQHSDPQLRGALSFAAANFIGAGMQKSRLDFDTWCIDSCQTLGTVPLTLEDIISVVKAVLQDQSPVAIRQACTGLKGCFPWLCCSRHSKVGLDLLHVLVHLKYNTYWLVKVECLEIFEELDFSLIAYLETQFIDAQHRGMHSSLSKSDYQEKLIKEVVLHLLGDDDSRVRNAAAKCLTKLVPNLMYSLENSKQAAVITSAQRIVDEMLLDNVNSYHPKSAHSEAVITANLSRLLIMITESLSHSKSKTMTLGCFSVLVLLSEAYPAAMFPVAWGCNVSSTCLSPLPTHSSGSGSTPPRPTSPAMVCTGGGGPLAVTVGCITSSWMAYDLSAHTQLMKLAGRLLFGLGSSGISVVLKIHSETQGGPQEDPSSPLHGWNIFSDSALAPLAEKLVVHLIRLLNVFSHIVNNVQPGAHSFKISFPGQNKEKATPGPGVATPQATTQPTSNPVSAVPKKLLTKTKRALSEADMSHSVLDKPVSPQKTHGSGTQAPEGEQTPQAPPPKSSMGTFHTVPHYMKLYDVMKGAFGNYQVTLTASEQDKFCSFLGATLETLAIVLEMTTFSDIGKHVEEILGYLQLCVKVEPAKNFLCVQQLLRAMFGINAVSQPELIQLPVIPPCLDRTLITVPVTLATEPLQFTGGRLYHSCFVRPLKKLSQVLEKAATSAEERETSSKGGIGNLLKKLRRKTGSAFRPSFKLDKQSPVHSFIRLFEPLVIRALKEYTMSSSIALQEQVLSLLAQLIKLRVNYSMLDADQLFIAFVQKQFEFIDAGQIRSCETFLPHVFQFLVLLSYQCFQPKFNQAKAIVGMPTIIQLCDGIMAGGQPARTHAIPSLQPIVHDLFVLRGAGKSDSSRDLDTQREVVVSMLLRLIQHPEVFEMLVTVLNFYRHDEEEKWKKLSRQITDMIMPMLAKQQVSVESEFGFKMLRFLFEAVSPASLRPVDVMLKTLFRSPDMMRVPVLERWLSMVLVLLQIILVQVNEDILLARINQASIRPDFIDMVSDDKSPVNPRTLRPEEVFSKFLFHVVETLFTKLSSLSVQPFESQERIAFLCRQSGFLLLLLVHLLKSESFKKVSQASRTLCPTALIKINSSAILLVDIHPVLVLQWAHVLRQLKYTDTHFWYHLLESRTSLGNTARHSEFEGQPLNHEIVKQGALLLYCDLLVMQQLEGACNLSSIQTIVKMCLVELVEMIAEPPVQGLMSVLHGTGEGSAVLIQAVTSIGSPVWKSMMNQVGFMKCLLQCLEDTHSSQVCPLLKVLSDYFLDSHCRSVTRMVESHICKRLEAAIASFQEEASDSFFKEEVTSVCQLIASKKTAHRNPRLYSLVSHVLDAESSSTQQHNYVEELVNSLQNYSVGLDWFSRLVRQCCSSEHLTDQILRARNSREAVQLLSALDYDSVMDILNLENFDTSLLEECILSGVERTLLFASRRQDVEDPSVRHVYEDLSHFNSTGVDHLLRAGKSSVFTHVSQVVDQVIRTKSMKGPDSDRGTPLACLCVTQEQLYHHSHDPRWCNRVVHLARAVVAFTGAKHSLPSQCKLSQPELDSLCRFVFVPLALVYYNFRNNQSPSSGELKTSLECLGKFLQLDLSKAVGEVMFAPLVCSAISHVHRLLKTVMVMLPESHNSSSESTQDGQRPGEDSDAFCMVTRACEQVVELVHCIHTHLSLGPDRQSTVPQFLCSPFHTVIVGLARLPLVNSYARTPPVVWKFGWMPTPEGPLKTELPPLPIEILKEKDVLHEFVRRVNVLGWTSRQQFEETWAALLGVLSSPPNPESVSPEEDMESTHACCLAVRCISALLLQTTLYPVPGNPVTGAHLHRPRNRDLPFLGSRAGKKLRIVRGLIEEEFVSTCCTGAGQMYLSGEDVNQERFASIYRSNSFMFKNSSSAVWVSSRLLFDHPLYGLNIDRLTGFHDYTMGQVSITALYDQAQAEIQDFSDSEDDGAIVVALPRMPRPEKPDIKSCEQFLLELFQQWISPYVHPRTSLMLLTEATKALLVLSDLFVDGTHFELILEALLDLYHMHPTEDEILIQYLLPTVCKAVAFLKTEGPTAEKVCKIMEASLKSPHVPLQVSALYGAMYILESHVTSVVALVIPLLQDFLDKRLSGLHDAVSLAQQHLLVMWSTAFYLLERYADEINDHEFKSNILKSAVRVASSNEENTPPCIYHAIMRGLERLVVSFALSSTQSDALVKLSVDRLSMQNPQRAISALGLLVTCMYTGKIGDRPSGLSVEFPTEDTLLIAMERVTVMFDRIRKGFPSEARVVSRVLPRLLLDFFPAQEIMNKVIGEFLSSQQPYPELMAAVLLKVFEGLHNQGQKTEVRDWVLLSLGSFVQRTPLAMAVWSLSCFFVSASTNKWIRALFPHIVGRMGKLEAIDTKYFLASALDFFRNQNLDTSQKEIYMSTFRSVAAAGTPYRELLSCCSKTDGHERVF